VTLAQLARLALGQPGGSSAPFSAVVGIADLTRSPVTIDVQFSDVMVVGQPRSGRSTALRTMAVSLAAAGADVWSIGLADSSGIAGTGRHCGPKADAAAALLEELLVMTETYPEVPRVLVVDNVDRYDDQVLFDVAGKVQHTDVVRIVGAIEMRNLNGYTMNPMLTELRHAARTLVLQPGSVGEVYAQLGVRPPLRPGLKMTPGRGVLLIDRIPTVVQVATA
jgi:S-DNA-T family DNA segregation ATPase FtsK/SpoIIIE